MKNNTFFCLLFAFVSSCNVCYTQTISGFVKDALSGEPLIGAYCVDSVSKSSAITSENGFFSLTTRNKHESVLIVSYLGYNKNRVTVGKDSFVSSPFLINMFPNSSVIGELEVKSKISLQEQTLLGINTISIEKLQNAPSFTGEADIIKAITYLPGVTNGKEGYSNLHIRGGNRDQNLILLDGATLYSTNHVTGFISLFNADAIKKIDLYKAGFPARYGDRVSSVLDIRMREGNSKERKRSAHIGITSASIIFEGPIKNEKTSYLVSARTSYLDLLQIKNIRQYNRTNKGGYVTYTFADFNAKISHYRKPNEQIYLNLYAGGDRNVAKRKFSNATDEGYKYLANLSVTLGLNKQLNQYLFLQQSIHYTKSFNEFGEKIIDIKSLAKDEVEQNTFSFVDDFTLKNNISVSYFQNHAIKIGLQGSLVNYNFGLNYFSQRYNKEVLEKDTVPIFNLKQTSKIVNLYIEDEIAINSKLFVNAGLRASIYKAQNNPIYKALEPRISLRMPLSSKSSGKLSYANTTQYNHLLVQSVNGFEREIWVASSKNVAPQKGYQFSLGYFAEFSNRNIETSCEVFYKKMSNQIIYTNVTDNAKIGQWENFIQKNGEGKAYGIEFLLQQEKERFNYSFSYTLSWVYQRFEQINQGKWTPSLYDRRQVVNGLAYYSLTKKWSVGIGWSYQTGSPFSFPIASSLSNPLISKQYFIYEEGNNIRLPDYHRLDIMLKKETVLSKKKKRFLTINIYNAYNQKNTNYIFVRNNKVYGITQFPILPTVSYGWKF